ncbi:MAG TPA: penicillin-binding transpeptidase domain-containing protein [Candidatus Nanopelagicales bacterium]
MSRSLNRLALGLLVLMVALLVQLTRLQVLRADELNAMPGNQRTLLIEYSRERGPILVDRAPIAESIETDDTLKYLRRYPDGAPYASATGFYSLVFGATGLEKAENAVLSGEDPRLFVDRMQQLIAGRQTQGGAVTTTLDAAAQQAAWQGIRGKTGSVVAIEPATGRILAQVQSPSFDPNKLSSHDSKAINEYYDALDADPDKPLLNRPIAKTNPPGSTFKVVTAAAALESGRFTPDSVLPGPATYTLPGTNVELPNWTGTECGPDGRVTLAEALAISCNTAFAWLGNELGADALRDQAEKFGFEEAFETPQKVATSRFPEDPDEAQTAMAAIGQFDVRATTLQMAMVVAAVGNGGVTMRPGIVEQTSAPDLSPLETFEPSQFADALTPEHAAELTEMMVGVVSNGTGSSARIPGVAVAGKTGTAQTSDDRPSIAWFVAFAPAVNPEVAVAVAVEDAGTNEVSGNQLAGPIARDVMEAVLGG